MEFSRSDEQEAFLTPVRAFAVDRVAPRAAEIDVTGTFPRDLVREAAALGLTGMTLPTSAGGAGQSYATYAAMIELVSAASATVAVILSVNNSLVAEPLYEFGTDLQKDTWLRRLATGEALGSFALS